MIPRSRDVTAVYAGDPRTVAEARAWTRGVLADLPTPLRDDALTCVSELATNAVRHTASGRPGGKYAVRLAVDPITRELVIEVRDECGTLATPQLRRPDQTAESGRGLRILSALGTVRTGPADPVAGSGRCVQVLLALPALVKGGGSA